MSLQSNTGSDPGFLKEAALGYAARGFRVAPLWPRGKHPLELLQRTEPSDDPEVIERWWSICPNANIALPTDNACNALVVLDLDVGEGVDGVKQLLELCRIHGITLPDTAAARTGSGGYHIYYSNPGHLVIPGGKDLFPGIDVRAEGAHIVAPPSVHHTGKRYEWIHGDISRIAPLDESVLRLLALAK